VTTRASSSCSKRIGRPVSRTDGSERASIVSFVGNHYRAALTDHVGNCRRGRGIAGLASDVHICRCAVQGPFEKLDDAESSSIASNSARYRRSAFAQTSSPLLTSGKRSTQVRRMTHVTNRAADRSCSLGRRRRSPCVEQHPQRPRRPCLSAAGLPRFR
jgi:hypothetical protein